MRYGTWYAGSNYIFDIESAGTDKTCAGILAETTLTNAYIFNNTIGDVQQNGSGNTFANGILFTSSSDTFTVKNNIVFNMDSGATNYDCYRNTGNATANRNQADDTTTPGTNPANSIAGSATVTTLTRGSEDYTLLVTANAKATGEDLSSLDSSWSKYDIVNTDRTGATWDKGADQITAAATADGRDHSVYAGVDRGIYRGVV
jgi:hypothetical protein